jgi:hypothetical protein
MSNVEQVIYVSRARPGLGGDDLARILASARRRNPAQGLTGFLAFHGQAFLQVLEGSPAALTSCLASLVTDTRHSQIRLVAVGPVAQRRFATWSMGYAPVATRHLDLLPEARADATEALLRVDADTALVLLQALAADAAATGSEATPAPLASGAGATAGASSLFSASSIRWPAA